MVLIIKHFYWLFQKYLIVYWCQFILISGLTHLCVV
jgi:hypothetical protein